MYQENHFRTFNIWRDDDILHVFINVPPKKYPQYIKTVEYVRKVLLLNFTTDYEDDQIYFVLQDFGDYRDFKECFFRYLCCFAKENKR